MIFPKKLYRFILLVLIIVQITGCTTKPTAIDRQPSLSFDQPQTTMLGKMIEPRQLSRTTAQSGFYILSSGKQAFVERLALIESAQKSLDAQYYIWNSDTAGTYMAQRLLLAAERGVRVRILLDDININDRDDVIALLSSHSNIDVRIYNPFATRKGMAKWLGFLAEFSRLNRRMHNKTFVADGAFGIVGGRNIGDEYFDMDPELNFRDRDILATGPIVKQISNNFDAYWNSPWSFPIHALIKDKPEQSYLESWLENNLVAAHDTQSLCYNPPQGFEQGLQNIQSILTQMVWAEAELIYDQPVPSDIDDLNSYKLTAESLGKEISLAQKEVLIESAYFVLGEEQLEKAGELADRGVQIRALTNSLASNDLLTNHSGYGKGRKDMLRKGIALHEFRPDALSFSESLASTGRCGEQAATGLHAKSIVFDRKTLYIGSFNINLRSAYLNFETVLVVRSPELAQQVVDDIETYLRPENSWAVWLNKQGDLRWGTEMGVEKYSHDPETDWLRRFQVGILVLFPLEKYF